MYCYICSKLVDIEDDSNYISRWKGSICHTFCHYSKNDKDHYLNCCNYWKLAEGMMEIDIDNPHCNHCNRWIDLSSEDNFASYPIGSEDSYIMHSYCAALSFCQPYNISENENPYFISDIDHPAFKEIIEKL